jgi:hypothetical protein
VSGLESAREALIKRIADIDRRLYLLAKEGEAES